MSLAIGDAFHTGTAFGVVLSVNVQRGVALIELQNKDRGEAPIPAILVGRQRLDAAASWCFTSELAR